MNLYLYAHCMQLKYTKIPFQNFDLTVIKTKWESVKAQQHYLTFLF